MKGAAIRLWPSRRPRRNRRLRRPCLSLSLRPCLSLRPRLSLSLRPCLSRHMIPGLTPGRLMIPGRLLPLSLTLRRHMTPGRLMMLRPAMIPRPCLSQSPAMIPRPAPARMPGKRGRVLIPEQTVQTVFRPPPAGRKAAIVTARAGASARRAGRINLKPGA